MQFSFDTTITGTNNSDDLTGDNGNDFINGFSGDDVLIGLEGNDFLDVLGGNNTLYGGAGNDWLLVGASEEDQGGQTDQKSYAHGGKGDDILSAAWFTGTVTLAGGKGNDILRTSDGSSEMRGGSGHDKIYISYDHLDVGYNHTMTGGAGTDIFIFNPYEVRAEGTNVITDFTIGKDQIQFIGNPNPWYQDHFYEFSELIIADDGDDVRVGLVDGRSVLVLGATVADLDECQFFGLKKLGSEDADTIVGSERFDVFVGLGGPDTLEGGKGKDTIFGDNGEDLLRGGNGQDYLFGGMGKDTIRGGHGDDRLEANGTSFPIETDMSKNFLFGGAGDDLVLSNYAHGGNFLSGGSGNDTLRGGNGDDTLVGGSGVDHLDGGAGADVFVFDSSTAWRERIGGFQAGVDLFRMKGTEASSFAELNIFAATIVDTNGEEKEGVVVNYGNGSLFLYFKTVAEVSDAASFEFV